MAQTGSHARQKSGTALVIPFVPICAALRWCFTYDLLSLCVCFEPYASVLAKRSKNCMQKEALSDIAGAADTGNSTVNCLLGRADSVEKYCTHAISCPRLYRKYSIKRLFYCLSRIHSRLPVVVRLLCAVVVPPRLCSTASSLSAATCVLCERWPWWLPRHRSAQAQRSLHANLPRFLSRRCGGFRSSIQMVCGGQARARPRVTDRSCARRLLRLHVGMCDTRADVLFSSPLCAER